VNDISGQSEKSPAGLWEDDFLVIGHRGAAGHAPENTLGSFVRALEIGVGMIELDVHLSADRQLVVIHDDTLERTTDGSGAVGAFTAAQLKEFDAGDGERLSTLDEVFDFVAGRCLINVELKGKGTADALIRFLEERNQDGALVSSFDWEMLKRCRELAPALRLAPLADELNGAVLEKAGELGAWSVNVSRAGLSREFVDKAHRAGFRVYVYTVNEPDEIENIRGMGVDGIISDYPDRLR
jgi:glycerophosphoryl diester phosphodiesterase